MTIHQTSARRAQLGSLATSFEFIYASGSERSAAKVKVEHITYGGRVSKRIACNVRLCRGLHKSTSSDAVLTDTYKSFVDFDFVSIYMAEDTESP